MYYILLALLTENHGYGIMRKIYVITESGRKILQEEYNRLNHLVEDGQIFFARQRRGEE